ncbi:PorP/SprF family type IX secretion system membrane protein [Fibrella aquatilis]|uniref:Type IX secretion system membrane protein PorP/SprF n=1 Tax=Fibrella aquatilis TaxID=2817059 RepID=A0A939JZA3_9BACT|nr:type IX secretion system membrane protein PorP/SprF [Fibrella aquatilis]MBO0929965.1 type IX secretion system membrane protein PorP/SprF [Fibrella aquatilis]
MLRKLYVLLGVCLLALPALGQTDPQFSFFMFTPTYLNPAAVGAEGVTRLQLIHRSQWTGYQAPSNFGGAPTSQLITADLPLNKINSGVGIYAFNDVVGPQTNQTVQLAYSYRLPIKNGALRIGVQAGLESQRIDYSGIILPDPSGPDPLVPTGQYSQFQPDFSAGLYYSTVDYWVGASIFHLTTPAYRLGTERGVNPLSRTAYFSAGYKLGLTYAIDLQPSVLYRYVEGNQLASTYDLSLLATYDGRYSVGASYRHQESITLLATANVLNNKARLGFAYDVVSYGQSTKRPGSFELLLSYVLPAPSSSPKPIVRTPRFRY